MGTSADGEALVDQCENFRLDEPRGAAELDRLGERTFPYELIDVGLAEADEAANFRDFEQAHCQIPIE
jgi:hypothetical protein